MGNLNEKVSKFFIIKYHQLELPFELFSMEYIMAELMNKSELFGSIKLVTVPEREIKKELLRYSKGENGEQLHFFSYIKFFEYNNKLFGLVGGKTNYNRPDISFDYLNELNGEKADNRIARNFLNENGLSWSRNIILINHGGNLERKADNKQAQFIECYLQRTFHLFDS